MSLASSACANGRGKEKGVNVQVWSARCGPLAALRNYFLALLFFFSPFFLVCAVEFGCETLHIGGVAQVCVRLRPLNEEEKRRTRNEVVVTNETRREVTIRQTVSGKAGKTLDKTFTFDRVYGANAPQSSIYETAVRPLVREVLAGYNCTIFAYGQTGTGKTYTMNGMENCRGDEGPRTIRQADGVIPRAINDIFRFVSPSSSF